VNKFSKAVAVLINGYRSGSLREFAGLVRVMLFRDEPILIYVKLLGDPDVLERRSDPRITKGHATDLAAAKASRKPVPWELQCDVYDGVRDFFVHIDDGTLGHISWLYYKDDPNRILRLEEGDCEIKFCLTFPEFRGRGIYPAALHAIQRYLVERGCSRCFVCVKADNIASIRGIEKAGFTRVGVTRFRKVVGVQISRPWPTWQLAKTGEDRRWIA
jgi:RimJ/RimL family protein N-acetyltransferase